MGGEEFVDIQEVRRQGSILAHHHWSADNCQTARPSLGTTPTAPLPRVGLADVVPVLVFDIATASEIVREELDAAPTLQLVCIPCPDQVVDDWDKLKHSLIHAHTAHVCAYWAWRCTECI